MQKIWRKCSAVVALTLACGCGVPDLVGAGGECISLSECQSGLTCVEGKCSSDLSSLAGDTPLYEDAAVAVMDASADAGDAGDAGAVSDAATVMDANMPKPDASIPKLDASTPQPDAAVPKDASLPDAAVHLDSAVPDAAVAVDAAEADAE